MARLNTHTSATPLQSRASTVDTLYRDPTPAARTSPYSVLSPALSQSSDKENDLPEPRQTTPPPAKRGLVAMVGTRAQRLPTPDSASTHHANPNKRQRTTKYDSGASELRGSSVGTYKDAPAEDGIAEEDDDFEQSLPTPDDAAIGHAEGDDKTAEPDLSTPHDDDEDEDEDDDPDSRYYNPNQPTEQRRQIRSGYRTLARDLEDNRDEYIKPNSNRLNELIPQATRVFSKVRMTADAVLDSHFLSSVTDLSSKQLKNSVDQGNHGIGVDLDQFVSRCIFFMKEGRPPGEDEDAQPTSRRPQQTQREDDDEEGDGEGEGLDWAYLGRHACFPSNSRPPLSSFLLGPLSVQKRVRNTTRRARQQRQPLGPATRPQEMKMDDMPKSETSDLTQRVATIKQRLKMHLTKAIEMVEADQTDDETEVVLRRHRVCANQNEEAVVSLFDFAVNPHSFGQTVENLFYISFLIREGAAKVETDANGLPLLAPEERSSDQRRDQSGDVQKRQAVFSLDHATWETLIKAFDIKEPLIPHRAPEETNIGAGGWYS